MSTPSNRPANPWMNEPQPQGNPRRTRIPATIATMAGVLVVVVLIVVGVWTLTGDDTDDSDTAAATFTESPEVTSDAPATVTTVTVAPEEDTEESGTPTAVPLPESSPEPFHEDATSHSGSGPLACNGRGVLIVNSVLDNAQNFDQQMADSRVKWPDAVLMEPGDCPSLRPVEPESGASVYAFVIDYGDDLDSLCAAERNGGGNARLLNSDTSYVSPC